MIQAKEYKTGNWIVDWETEEKYFQIEEIRKYIGYEVWAYYRNGSIKCKEPEPIELSEEILLKCGAKYDRLREREECIINGQCFEFYINDGKITLVYTGGEGVQMSLPLEYLHSLQNIMPFLTNEELTVNL